MAWDQALSTGCPSKVWSRRTAVSICCAVYLAVQQGR
jgi:hypothetical protein